MLTQQLLRIFFSKKRRRPLWEFIDWIVRRLSIECMPEGKVNFSYCLLVGNLLSMLPAFLLGPPLFVHRAQFAWTYFDCFTCLPFRAADQIGQPSRLQQIKPGKGIKQGSNLLSGKKLYDPAACLLNHFTLRIPSAISDQLDVMTFIFVCILTRFHSE